ncbi:MAG: hypothetical protein AB1486_33415 [Planctomycetota bacterium]
MRELGVVLGIDLDLVTGRLPAELLEKLQRREGGPRCKAPLQELSPVADTHG